MSISTKAITLGFALSVIAGGAAMAKGHDQGIGNGANPNFDGVPGQNAVNETAKAAKTLGDRRGFSGNTPAADKRKKKIK